MSIQALSHVLRRNFGNPTRKLLMAALADFADENGRAWPSIDTLAGRAECSRRSVQEHLAALVAAGDLKVISNAGRNGTHLYHIVFKKMPPPEIPADTPAEGVQNLHGGVQISGGDLRRGGADQRRQSAPNTSGTVKEPSGGGKASPAPAVALPIVQKLNDIFQDAPGVLTGKELASFTDAAPALDELTEDDWHALAAWHLAPPRALNRRSKWPRDRGEFLANAGQVIELTRQWWKTGGKSWWKSRSQPTPKPDSFPAVAIDPQELASIEDFREIFHRWKTA